MGSPPACFLVRVVSPHSSTAGNNNLRQLMALDQKGLYESAHVVVRSGRLGSVLLERVEEHPENGEWRERGQEALKQQAQV